AAYDDIIARLEGVSALIDQTIALMEQGLAAGITPPHVAIAGVSAQIRAQAEALAEDSPLLAAFRQFPASIDEAGGAGLRARAAKAYETFARPAFGRLLTFVDETYLPACREETAIAAL